MMIAVACICLHAQTAEKLPPMINDTVDIYVPSPNRIAQERIKKLRSFDMPDVSPLTDSTYVGLTLDDAANKLIVNNMEIKKAKYEYLAGEKRYLATFGVFEPYFTGAHEYSESERPDAVHLAELRESLTGGIEGVLPTATRYNFALIQKDIRFAQYTLEWPKISSVISITQPLLKDFFGNGPLSEIKLAKVERQIAYNRYRSTLMAQFYSLETMYWKLVYLQEKRGNAERSVSIAHQIVDDSRTLLASGTISKLDAVEISSQLAQREMVLSGIKIEHAGAMNSLLQMIGCTSDSALSVFTAVTPLVMTLETGVPDTVTIDAIDSILRNGQPDLLAAEYTSKRSRTAVSQLRGKNLPELNVTGSLGFFGANPNFNYAVEQFLDAEHRKQNWAYGVELKVPLGTGIRERNLIKAEKLNQKIAEVEESYLREELTSQSMLAVDKIHELTLNIANAVEVVEYRKTLLKSELFRLKAGLSNVRKIFEMEKDLSDARESELEMRAQFRMTLSLYDRLLGVTLSKRGLEETLQGKPQLIKELISE